ncbi:MAG: carboxypeptidase regulatory-like domain-containing protein [Bacteroidota bacterium]|nr:carboxypeptidase regulatory-like domain-containing protein [Bacteroidota bacterium]
MGNYKIEVRQGDTVVVFAEPMNRNFVAEFYDNQNNIADANRIGISGNVTGIDFVLDPKPVYANGISGTIKDTAGVPVQGHVTAFKTQLNGHNNNRHSEYTIESDSLGVYSLTNLVPGEYIIMVHPEGEYRPTFFRYDGTSTMNWKNADSIAITESGVVSDINFVVRTCVGGGNAAITGKIAQNNGTQINGALVYAFDANGDVAGYAVSNASGNYVMDGLIPGQYTVNTDKFGYTASSSKSVVLDYQSNLNGTVSLTLNPESPTDVETSASNEVTSYGLSQNYPNPFNPSTQIRYQIPTATNVVVKVFNVLGAEVATLVNGFQSAGSHSITFNASHLSSGIYLYTIKAGNFTATKKLVLMK